MDELVKDFQKVVAGILTPKSVRSRAEDSRSSSFRKQVVTAWYTGAQEFSYDAVGITVGGPCFLKAFSHFFRTRSNDHGYVPRDQQLQRRHPVTWLRIRMLVDRAAKHGMQSLAGGVQDAWAETVRVLGVQEDYEGTWADEVFLPLRQMLDNMIEGNCQVVPCAYGDESRRDPPDDSPMTSSYTLSVQSGGHAARMAAVSLIRKLWGNDASLGS
jgi:hypothetical protein